MRRALAPLRKWTLAALGPLCLVSLALALPGLAAAQLSPGPLSSPHAHLEGSANCLRCHSSGRGVDPERCLSCHQLLAERAAAGEGLHARREYADCKTCHQDHAGRAFELVWWGEEGIDAFDHASTGHELVGRHRRLGCRECHRAEHVADPARLERHGKRLGRTFLGLDTECLSCHQDEHRGQFAADACLSCHSQESWLPASGFDHQRARFPLTGLHRQVACEGCHRRRSEPLAGDADFVVFRGLAFGRCGDCHADPHDGRFGVGCADCHAVSGWLALDGAAFDHDLTRYPLRGRHRQVPCEGCHRPGRARRGLASERCTDCHRDEHAGQLAGRPDAGRCEACHSVDGFAPASFSLDDHEPIFPLRGAHRDLDCAACHTPVSVATLVDEGLIPAAAASPSAETLRLRFAVTGCEACHADPHVGTALRGGEAAACAECHDTSAWSEIAFDHATTGFELEGPHATLGCRDCHRPAAAAEEVSLTFAGLRTACSACHEDPHRGQFARPDGSLSCLGCHGATAWIPAVAFDHDRDAAFALEGAHRRVSCDGCHRSEIDERGTFVRFKPLGRRCIDCHGGR